MKLNNSLSVLCAFSALLIAPLSQAAITSYEAKLTADDWPVGEGGPLRGNASIALDDSTNELSWAIEWAGTTARRAEVTMRSSDGKRRRGQPLVLDLEAGESTVDARGGELSGSVLLTPRQAEELSGDWQVEVRLVDKPGLRLTGKLELISLPPGLWL
ncbi:MAG: CHRD domain-containing protein [Pseudomonadota bacterium]